MACRAPDLPIPAPGRKSAFIARELRLILHQCGEDGQRLFVQRALGSYWRVLRQIAQPQPLLQRDVAAVIPLLSTEHAHQRRLAAAVDAGQPQPGRAPAWKTTRRKTRRVRQRIWSSFVPAERHGNPPKTRGGQTYATNILDFAARFNKAVFHIAGPTVDKCAAQTRWQDFPAFPFAHRHKNSKNETAEGNAMFYHNKGTQRIDCHVASCRGSTKRAGSADCTAYALRYAKWARGRPCAPVIRRGSDAGIDHMWTE